MIETQIKASYDCRFINNKQLEVWTRQLVEIDNFAIGLAMYLQKEGREKASRENKAKASVAKAKTEQAEEAVRLTPVVLYSMNLIRCSMVIQMMLNLNIFSR